jgi:hypothetical protein
MSKAWDEIEAVEILHLIQSTKGGGDAVIVIDRALRHDHFVGQAVPGQQLAATPFEFS